MPPELPPLLAEVMSKVTVEVLTRLPLVPVTVSVDEPATVVALVAMVNVVDPEPVTEVGLNVPVAPVGRPLTVNATAELNPFNAATVGVKLVPPP